MTPENEGHSERSMKSYIHPCNLNNSLENVSNGNDVAGGEDKINKEENENDGDQEDDLVDSDDER